MRHITLLTDFGTTEGEHTVMKGVIWKILPGAPVGDLSHAIDPQNILQAALVLQWTASYFPDETVHVVVVDPGVGTERKGIAARFGSQFFVGPDNGVCTPLLERAESEGAPVEIVELTNPDYWVHPVSPIFHGRDIFAPVGGHLAAGVPLDEFGPAMQEVVRLSIPKAKLQEDSLAGAVMHIDHFGNLICTQRRSEIEPLGSGCVYVGQTQVGPVLQTFGEKAEGELVAVYSPSNYLMVAVTNGSAKEQLGVSAGAPVRYVPDSFKSVRR
jgi:S-adenosyl-L-methionine hydrolase (adenosine-forming)